MSSECLTSSDRIEGSSESTIEDAVRANPRLAAYVLKEMATRLRTTLDALDRRKTIEQHNYEWWATYRAALSGVGVAVGTTEPAEIMRSCHEMCCQVATLAHGPLKEIES